MSQVNSDVAGSIWKIVCREGDTVKPGDELIIVESMKMEIPVEAPFAGTISSILVAEGEAITEGQAVIELSPASA
ncbi:MAG: acetyl-CoA carboxylase biotin carboxyl carrier protein subunit [Burkholderiaceae bacterium]